MTNRELIQRDIAVVFDFAEQIIDNPALLDKIPDGAAISFLNEEEKKIEKNTDNVSGKKYVRIKRHFELL